MNRHQLFAACLGICLASVVLGQDGQKEKEPPAVVELLEDDTGFLIDNLTNPGAQDGSIAERSEDTLFSGVRDLPIRDRP